MAKKSKFDTFMNKATDALNNIDVTKIVGKEDDSIINVKDLKKNVTKASTFIADKAVEAKDAAMDVKEDITDKLTELDRMLQQSVTDYNDAFTLMNDTMIH